MSGEALLLGAAKALNFVLKDLYDGAKGKFANELGKWKYEKNVNQLYSKIKGIRNVKTIWQTDKKIDLMTFYYPSKLIIDGTRCIVNSLNKIPSDRIVIEGTAGQGKSIFLRYLCTQELSLGGRLPVFLQLRKIQKSESLKENIFNVLDAWGFKINDELFDYLATESKIAIFLDGFDELQEEQVSGVVKELEFFSEKYQNLKIIITSRPSSGLQNCERFDVYPLAVIEAGDHVPFLNKLVKDQKIVTQMATAIKESGHRVSGLLTTPLMMTLLVFVYQAEQKIPNELSEFYEQLFPLMFYRHDKTKPGFVRKRHCSLHERDVRKVFEAVCYITRKKQLTELKESELLESAEEALNIFGLTCDVRGFVSDITKVSCLILEEGLSYYFIHKSVQEYHCACFIKSRPDPFAIQFYSRMLNHMSSLWSNELAFLSQIDRYRYHKYYFIPDIENIFNLSGIDENNIDGATKNEIQKLIKKIEANLYKDNVIRVNSFFCRSLNHDRLLIDFWDVLNNQGATGKENFRQEDVIRSGDLVQLLNELDLWNFVVETIKPILHKYSKLKSEAIAMLETEDNLSNLLP